MRGNIYISIPSGDNAKALPKSITKYDWKEYTYDDEGEVDTTTNIHPTWAQYGEKYQGDFGAPVVAGDHIVYEMEASWKDSEVSALVALGKGKSAPNYTIMTASEARAFIADNTDSQL